MRNRKVKEIVMKEENEIGKQMGGKKICKGS
jgi:hypothetical protein